MSVALYLPCMPFLANDLPINESIAQQAIFYFVLGQALAPLVLGPVADIYGYRIVMIFTMILIAISFILIINTKSMYIFLLLRFIQGGLSQTAISISRAMLLTKSSYKKSVIALSWVGVVQSFTHIIAPFIGGVIIEKLNWKYNFLFLFSISAMILVFTYYWDERGEKHIKVYTKINIQDISKIITSHVFIYYSLIVSTLNLITIFFFSMSPFYFILEHNINVDLFGIYIGITSLGYTLGSYVMSSFFYRFNHDKLINYGLYIILICGILTLVSSFYNYKIIIILVITQFVYAFSKSIILPILQTKAIELFPNKKVTCSSVFNFISTIVAPFGALLSSKIDNDKIVFIYSLILIFCSIISIIFFLFTIRIKGAELLSRET